MTTPRKLLERIDAWWTERAPRRRLDRNAGNMCMLVGLMLPSLSIILQGPTPNSALEDMPVNLQVWMCLCIFGGCAIKLHGGLCGSRWYFPRTTLTKAYQWGYTGAPMATVGTLVYGYFLLHGTQTPLSAMGAVSTPMFGVGISFQAFFYWLESRRIASNERVLLQQARDELGR